MSNEMSWLLSICDLTFDRVHNNVTASFAISSKCFCMRGIVLPKAVSFCSHLLHIFGFLCVLSCFAMKPDSLAEY